MKNKIPTNHDEMIIYCSTFKELLDIEKWEPRNPRARAVQYRCRSILRDRNAKKRYSQYWCCY